MNIVLYTAVSAWAVAQLIKFVIAFLKNSHFDFHYFVSSGGMPSAHSATVCALATSVGKLQGFNSAAFAISAILAIIVMYDSAGVRQSVSRQSAVLNRIVAELSVKRPRAEMEHDLKVLIGHTPFQVLVGGLLGVAVAFIWFYLTNTL